MVTKEQLQEAATAYRELLIADLKESIKNKTAVLKGDNLVTPNGQSVFVGRDNNGYICLSLTEFVGDDCIKVEESIPYINERKIEALSARIQKDQEELNKLLQDGKDTEGNH